MTRDRQPVLPWPQLPHLGRAAGPCPCPQEPWSRAVPPEAGQCHTATSNDETPGVTHCCSSRHPALLCSVAQGGATRCPFLTFLAFQAGHEVSPVQLAARPPRAEQQGRICPFHHGPCWRPTQVGLDCGQFHRPWAHRQVLYRQGCLSEATTKLGGYNTCLDGGRWRRTALLTPNQWEQLLPEPS